MTIDAERHVRAWYLCERGWMLLELGFRDLRPRDDFFAYLVPLGEPPTDTEVYSCVVRGSMIFRRLSLRFSRGPVITPTR